MKEAMMRGKLVLAAVLVAVTLSLGWTPSRADARPRRVYYYYPAAYQPTVTYYSYPAYSYPYTSSYYDPYTTSYYYPYTTSYYSTPYTTSYYSTPYTSYYYSPSPYTYSSYYY